MTIVYIWKIKNNKVPNDINFQFSSNGRRSGNKAVVKPLPKVKGKLLSIYESGFQIRAAKLWNKVPNEITSINNLNTFKESLNDYLLLYPDKPPVKGYYHVNNNSLLDYQTVKI